MKRILVLLALLLAVCASACAAAETPSAYSDAGGASDNENLAAKSGGVSRRSATPAPAEGTQMEAALGEGELAATSSAEESAAGAVTDTAAPLAAPPVTESGREDEKPGDGVGVNLTVGEAVFYVQLLDNASAHLLLAQMPLTLEMSDYASQEKVAVLPFDFPAAATEQPATIRAGELYLWSGNQLVLFYTTFQNSYGGYVRLGSIADTSGLQTALGAQGVALTLSVAE